MCADTTAGRAAALPVPTLPVLGVGVVYTPRLEPLIAAAGDQLDLIEVEPQTLWRRAADTAERYVVDRAQLDQVAAIAYPKVLHGVGFPIGGARQPSAAQIPPLLETIEALAPPWMSEHIAFNRMMHGGRMLDTGFLLPPRQTAAGVAAAAASIRSVSERLPIPFAVENGVSYLAPRDDELSDGAFVAAIVEAADCGLLLDLHNAWANHRNGRQNLDEFLAQIPLDRVWEIHLAGGMDYRGYWLDAHSGDIAEPLIEIAAEVIPRLPNLKALIFEITPSFLDLVAFDAVERQIGRLHELWKRRPATPRQAPVAPTPTVVDAPATAADPEHWEDTLGALVIGRDVEGPLGRELAADPGLDIFRHLVGEFRASTVIGTLPFSGRLLLLTLGTQRFEQILAGFWRQSPPEAFGSREAQAFARHVATLGLDVALLDELLAYDVAVIDALVEDKRQEIRFRHDPRPILVALADHRLPGEVPEGEFVAEITTAGITFRALERDVA